MERFEFILCAFLAHEIPFWIYCFIEWFLTRFKLLQKFKIEEKNPSSELVYKSYKQVFIAHFVFQWITLYFAYDLVRLRGCFDVAFPSIFMFVIQFAWNICVCDTLLYWNHRTLHHPSLYARFHKQHHEYKSPIPVSSEYFTFVEELATGVIPTMAGPMIWGQNYLVIFMWIIFRVSESSDAHSGYNLPFSIFRLGRPSDRHWFHHSHNTGCFGAFLTFWDRVGGSDVTYLEWKKSEAAKKAR